MGFKANAFYYCNFMVTRKQEKEKEKHKRKLPQVQYPIQLLYR